MELESHWFGQSYEEAWGWGTPPDTGGELVIADAYTWDHKGIGCDGFLKGFEVEAELSWGGVEIKNATLGVGRGKRLDHMNGDGLRKLVDLLSIAEE